MELLSSTQKHVNCFYQGYKCFCEIFSLRLANTYCC